MYILQHLHYKNSIIQLALKNIADLRSVKVITSAKLLSSEILTKSFTLFSRAKTV